ncbi:MAG: sigma-54-dependent Fis family transcriptional regulator [Deltaproteobacteria bacterium]|nr:sigma-54-dependent Fis family transcriptional regulator [Deltaproteobacteria bacterium]
MDDLKLKYKEVLALWKKFINNEPINYSGIISQDILSGWERCKELDVDPYMQKVAFVLDRDELVVRLRKNEELIEVCTPFMENLYALVKGSGFIVALFDSEGFLLHIIGDKNILDNLTIGNFVLGSCWREEIMGTNGVGTVLNTGKPKQIFACEHYAKLAHKYTCSGAPLHNPNGDVIGVIDVTGFYYNANPHTLGMATAAATAIDNIFVVKQAFTQCQISENLQKTVFSSIPEALIAIDNNGLITLLNHNAEKMLQRPSSQILGENFLAVFGPKNDHFISLVDHNRALTDREVRITLNNGMTADYTLTCNPILSPQKQVTGKIIILTEIKRTRQLVTSMMGAKANFFFEDIIGGNPSFLQNIELAKIAAGSDSNVLLLGQSGTGKDIFAQAIHNKSYRKDSPYLAINCAAIPRDLIASELFGYEEGAFTGSKKGGNPGKFELADGGTIFLDEIGEMPLESQSTLLRVIEEKTIFRIGAKKIRHVDVRIIAATNKNLQEELEKRTFRADLFYRLNVFTIKLVALRERADDIPLLVKYFVKNLARKNGKQIKKIHPDFITALKNHSWPGNVRELQNYIERAVNITPNNELAANLLPLELMKGLHKEPEKFEIETVSSEKVPDETNLEEIERNLIINMLNATCPRKEIAEKLGISRTTLYRKILQITNQSRL